MVTKGEGMEPAHTSRWWWGGGQREKPTRHRFQRRDRIKRATKKKVIRRGKKPEKPRTVRKQLPTLVG